MSVHFELSTLIHAPPLLVFDLSLDVDVHLDSMAGSQEEIVGGIGQGEMKLGDTVTWRAKHFGIWWKMTSEIVEYDRPEMFVDQQAKGPFASFRHLHEFEMIGPVETSMRDEIWFDAPFGPVGDAVEALVLGKYLKHLIEVRNVELKERAEALYAATNPK